MQALRDALWQADEAAGWHDNVTIALAQVLSGGASAAEQSAPISNTKAELLSKLSRQERKSRRRGFIIWFLIPLLLIVGGALCWQNRSKIKTWLTKDPVQTEQTVNEGDEQAEETNPAQPEGDSQEGGETNQSDSQPKQE